MVQTLEKVRFEFVDWMKVIGMFVIILGHFAPPIYKVWYIRSVFSCSSLSLAFCFMLKIMVRTFGRKTLEAYWFHISFGVLLGLLLLT